MKKGATPTHYKTVEQQRLLQDIFKTPNQQIHDESSEEVQINTDKRKTFEGAEDATIPLVSGNSAESVTMSTPVLKRFVPRPQSLLRHQAEQRASSTTTPQSFFKPSIVRLVPLPSSLPAAMLPIPTTSGAPTVPIPTASGATTLSSGTSQNFNIFNTHQI